MSRQVVSLVLVTTLTLVFTSDVMAQRGRGGGGRPGGGGGGMSRAGGGAGFSGGGPSGSFNRSPSMSRPMPNMNFPTPNMPRPMTPNMPGGGNFAGGIPNRGAGMGFPGGAGNLATSPRAAIGQINLGSTQSFNRPTQNELGNFLNMPNSPANSGFGGITGRSGSGDPFGSGSATFSGDRGSGSGQSGSRTFTTEGGSTITVGGAGGRGTTDSGVQVGGAVGGIKVETPGGETYGRVSGVGGATDGTNSAIRGGSITGASDGQGNAAVNVRGGYADSSGYRQGGSVTARRNDAGYTSVTGRGGYGYGDGTGHIGAAGVVRTPSGNVIAAGRGASFVNGQFIGGQTWAAVNGNYTHWNAFGPNYYINYPNAWWPGRWAVATTAWATATYAMAGAYCGCSSTEGVYYDYGDNVTYVDGNVYQDGQQVATSEEYYQQANQISSAAATSTNEEWMPLGVFAVVTEGQTQSDKIVQLALNREGVIRGNLQDLTTDKVVQVSGSVDKQTQRVAIKIEGNDQVVIETGLYNLTNDEVPILVHFDANRQEARTLVRLQQPEDQAGQSGQPAAPSGQPAGQ